MLSRLVRHLKQPKMLKGVDETHLKQPENANHIFEIRPLIYSGNLLCTWY